MKPEFETAGVAKAFEIFIVRLNKQHFESLGISLVENTQLVRLYMEVFWNDDDQFEVTLNVDGVPNTVQEEYRFVETEVDADAFITQLGNLFKNCNSTRRHIAYVVPDIVMLIATTFFVPDDLRIYFGAEFLGEYERDFFAFTTADLLGVEDLSEAQNVS